MSRLIVVSNRVNPPSGRGGESVGGLAMALAAALREPSGVWFGWSGQITPEYTGQISMQRSGDVTVATVDLEEQRAMAGSMRASPRRWRRWWPRATSSGCTTTT